MPSASSAAAARAAALCLLALGAASVSAQPPFLVDQGLCELSGGEWSECASPCPLTCETIKDTPAPCPTVCVLGCVCPQGFVLDPVFGCKPAASCQPQPCCTALTADCEACKAGVSLEQFCAALPDFEGCPEPKPDPVVDEQLCQASGGEWSTCASACPTTCDTLGVPVFCPDVCTTGCICPAGSVFDPVFGCKPESACTPGPCCSALTAECLACAAGVSIEQYCLVFPDTEGCEPTNPCSIVLCPPGQICKVVTLPCLVPPCPMEPQCTAADPCASVTCPEDHACKPTTLPCLVPPCPQVGECFPSSKATPINTESQLDQAVCEISGGVWSSCASACPTTCDNIFDAPIPCTTQCVLGCQCPLGFVLDDEFGCKPSSSCEPQICCEALTAECEACAEGIPVEQFCAIKPDFLGCQQELCELSGGEWSTCASACPTTCETLGEDTLCIEICTLGCVCPEGSVLDPVFGCKPEASCAPATCCLALTAECLACGAGIPIEQFCQAKPDTLGCEPFIDPCTLVDCDDSQFCALVNVICVTEPCPPIAVCTPVAYQLEYESCVDQDNEWRECLGCRATCIDPDATSCVPSDDCTPGCECAPGQLFDPEASICVLEDECPCEEAILGDLNKDDAVTVQDTIVLVSIAISESQLSQCDFPIGNLNGDEAINIQDIVQLLALILGNPL